MNSDSLSVKWGYFYKPCSVAVEIKSLINDNILSLLLDHLLLPVIVPLIVFYQLTELLSLHHSP